MQVELHSYLELSDDFSVMAPYVLVGMGVFVLLIGVMACCCTVNGQPALLYLVRDCWHNRRESELNLNANSTVAS